MTHLLRFLAILMDTIPMKVSHESGPEESLSKTFIAKGDDIISLPSFILRVSVHGMVERADAK